MRYLSVSEVLEIHHPIMQQAGTSLSIHGLAAPESAVAQPRMAFGGAELYPTLAEKAAALDFSFIRNHPFVDGNKRTEHAALETFLVLNEQELDAAAEEQFAVVLRVAASAISREAFLEWLREHIVPLS